ncbi:hypothetical protein [Methanobrevibacter woesei]|uniref:hypothetical protein n=1 Tax=Methanobrevibacter woesei TaxID=190976 RepID=UPI0024B8726A|nr:hypothetical protein [Methanobrevibacter woesei]
MDNIKEGFNFYDNFSEFYGIEPHENAVKIANYEFFWDCTDELAPFGSDEGYLSFVELINWIEENPDKPILECIRWILSSWNLKLSDYNESILYEENIIEDTLDYRFDRIVLTLDIVLIATGFGQLILQGKMDENIKNIVHLAILRQMNSYVLDAFLEDNEEWKYERYKYLQILLDILEKA